jgi:hypothetical protein
MAYGLTFRLEREDGTPADPPTFRSASGVTWGGVLCPDPRQNRPRRKNGTGSSVA